MARAALDAELERREGRIFWGTFSRDQMGRARQAGPHPERLPDTHHPPRAPRAPRAEGSVHPAPSNGDTRSLTKTSRSARVGHTHRFDLGLSHFPPAPGPSRSQEQHLPGVPALPPPPAPLRFPPGPGTPV